MSDDKNLMQSQCWICPICFDDHRVGPYCKISDLHEIIERQRTQITCLRTAIESFNSYAWAQFNIRSSGFNIEGIKFFFDKFQIALLLVSK